MRAEGGRIIVEVLPSDPYGAPAEALEDIDYAEAKNERKAEEWLRKNARPRHTGAIRV